MTVTLDDDVFRAVKIKAARTGKCDSRVIEESLRRDLGLDDLAEIWAKVSPATEGEGMALATDELRAMRKEGRGAAGT
jgi:gamma-glutamyl:cysteine ligase YbdK (ATP-grasp superfamily)